MNKLKAVHTVPSSGLFCGLRPTRSNDDLMIAIVDPATAKRFLERAAPNRTIKQANLAKLATDLADNRWKYDGAPIRFDEHGFLIDGQHRLAAIVQTGISAECLLVKNVPSQSMDVIDSGRSRTEAESLQIAGEKHATALASSLKLYLTYSRALAQDWGMVTAVDNARTISRQEITAALEAFPNFRRAAEMGRKFGKITSPAGAATAYYLLALEEGLSDDDRLLADVFFDAVYTGANLREGSPTLALRNKLNSMRTGQIGNNKLIGAFSLYYFIRAWNAEKRGERLSRMHTPGTTDCFPRIV